MSIRAHCAQLYLYFSTWKALLEALFCHFFIVTDSPPMLFLLTDSEIWNATTFSSYNILEVNRNYGLVRLGREAEILYVNQNGKVYKQNKTNWHIFSLKESRKLNNEGSMQNLTNSFFVDSGEISSCSNETHETTISTDKVTFFFDYVLRYSVVQGSSFRCLSSLFEPFIPIKNLSEWWTLYLHTFLYGIVVQASAVILPNSCNYFTLRI